MQSDQMDRLFINIWPITSVRAAQFAKVGTKVAKAKKVAKVGTKVAIGKKVAKVGTKVAKVGVKVDKYFINPQKSYQAFKMLPKWWRFTKFGHAD